MPRISVLILPVLTLAGTVQAASLTVENCTTLAELYGIHPAECAAAPTGGLQDAGLIIGGSLPAAASLTLLPAATAAPQPDAMRIDHVFFMSGGSGLDAAARAQLDAFARLLESPPLLRACLGLVGHADSSGDNDANIQLSGARADVVANFLRERLAFPARVVAVQAAGSSSPLPGFVPTAPEQRRVTLMLRDCAASDLVSG